jgi:hypothetical protein
MSVRSRPRAQHPRTLESMSSYVTTLPSACEVEMCVL